MCSNDIDLDGLAEAVGEMPPLYRPFVEAALASENPDEIVGIGLSMTGERRQPGLIINLGSSSVAKNSLWDRVVDEVHDFLCTKSREYKEERLKGASGFNSLVHVIATALGSTLNIGMGILSGLVSIALVLVAKVGKNAWCKQYASAHTS